jgi:aspartate/tyrosine/aromatic aminotransferase
MVTDRIDSMRKLLRKNLESIGTKGTWDHVTTQIGRYVLLHWIDTKAE